MRPSRRHLSIYPVMVAQFMVGGAFLPFVTVYLREDRGLTVDEVGWANAVAALVGSTVPFFWGWVADQHISTERLLAGLHLVGGAALYVFSLQRGFWGLLGGYALVFAFYSPTFALLSSLAYHNLAAPEKEFGKVRLFGSLGWMLPSLPIFLRMQGRAPEAVGGFEGTLQLAAVFALMTAGSCLLLPRTPPHVRAAGVPFGQALRRLFAVPGIPVFLAVILLAHAAYSVVFYYSPLALREAGFDRKWIGPLQCLGVVVEPALLLLLPRVLGRLGFRRAIALGCLLLVARHLIYAFPSPRWLLAGSYVLVGACVAYYLTGVSLFLNARAERAVRASAQTLLALLGPGLGQMAGHRAVGWLTTIPGLGLRAGFIFAACSAALAWILLCLPLRRSVLFSVEQPAGEKKEGRAEDSASHLSPTN